MGSSHVTGRAPTGSRFAVESCRRAGNSVPLPALPLDASCRPARAPSLATLLPDLVLPSLVLRPSAMTERVRSRAANPSDGEVECEQGSQTVS